MNAEREGGCTCGEVRYRLTSEPLFVHCCHCLNCQRQTGSAFVVNLLIESDRVELPAGEPKPVEVPRDDGSKQVIFRCPTCQVAVFSLYRSPIVRLAFGTFLAAPDPLTVFGDVELVRPRFAAAPDWAFAAELDGEVVGSNLAARWGSYGSFGPLSVHPDHWNRGIASRLLEPVT